MGFGDEITKLKFGATDNRQRNTQAETDLQNKLDQFETDLQINNNFASYQYLPASDWKRLYENPLSYQNSIIGYKEDVLQSIELGHPSSTTQFENFNFADMANANLFLSSFFYPKCNSYMHSYPQEYDSVLKPQHYKKFDCLILNNHQFTDLELNLMPSMNFEVMQKNGQFYHMRDFAFSNSAFYTHWGTYPGNTRGFNQDGYKSEDQDGKIVDGHLINIINQDLSKREKYSLQRESSSFPSVTVRFSINKTTDSSWDTQISGFTTKGIWVGLFLLNQPLWSLPENADLSLRYPQSDCFFSLIEVEGRRYSYNGYDPINPIRAYRFNPYNTKLYCGRLNYAGNRNTLIGIPKAESNTVSTVAIHTSQLYTPLRFDTNYTSNTISGCDNNFTMYGINFGGYEYSTSQQFPYTYIEGPVINELKFEYGHVYGSDDDNDYDDFSETTPDTFMINVYYNGELVEQMVTSRVNGNPNPMFSRGWWNQCHYIPGIILNAPEGMIKIHSFETDMD